MKALEAPYNEPTTQGDVESSGTERLEPKSTMSCRIDRDVDGKGCVVLRVSGRIHPENVDTLRELLGTEKGQVAIDLKEVILVDREAVGLLASSEMNGTELRNCPAYIREWVTRERSRFGDIRTEQRNNG